MLPTSRWNDGKARIKAGLSFLAKSAGFTFLDIVAAVTILSVSAAGVFATYQVIDAQNQRMQTHQKASDFAFQRVEELKNTDFDDWESISSEKDGVRYSITVTLEEEGHKKAVVDVLNDADESVYSLEVRRTQYGRAGTSGSEEMTWGNIGFTFTEQPSKDYPSTESEMRQTLYTDPNTHPRGLVYSVKKGQSRLASLSMETGVWKRHSNLPTGYVLQNNALVYCNNKVYVAGSLQNSSSSTYTTALWAYDELTNAWAVEATLPYAINGATGACYNNNLYIFGGTNKTASVVTNKTMIFSTTGKTFSYGMDMIGTSGTTRFDAWGAKAGNRFVAGYNYKIYIYDFALNLWAQSTVTESGTYLDQGPIAALGDGSTVFSLQAYQGSNTTQNIVYYNVDTNTWTNTGGLGYYVKMFDGWGWKGKAIGFDSAFYLLKYWSPGMTTIKYYGMVNPGKARYTYNTATTDGLTLYSIPNHYSISYMTPKWIQTWNSNTWELGGIGIPETAQASLVKMVYYNRHLYLAGGKNEAGTDVKTFHSYNLDTGIWERLPDLPVERSNGGIAAVDGKIYYHGGAGHGTTAKGTMLTYDITAKTWTSKETGLTLSGHTLCYDGAGNFYIPTGDLNQPTSRFPYMFVYNIAAGTYQQKAAQTNLSSGYGAFYWLGKVYVLSNTYEAIYDVATNTWTGKTVYVAHNGDVLPFNNGYAYRTFGFLDNTQSVDRTHNFIKFAQLPMPPTKENI